MLTVISSDETDADLARQLAGQLQEAGVEVHRIRHLGWTGLQELQERSEVVHWLVVLSPAYLSASTIDDWTSDRTDRRLGRPGMLTVLLTPGAKAPALTPTDRVVRFEDAMQALQVPPTRSAQGLPEAARYVLRAAWYHLRTGYSQARPKS